MSLTRTLLDGKGSPEANHENHTTQTICLPPIVHHLSTSSKRARNKFTPYNKPPGPSTLELQFTEKSLGRVDSSEITLEDTQEGRSIFLHGLASLSDQAMSQALEARQADHESKHLRALSMAWEIEASDQHRRFLLTLHKEETSHYTLAANEVTFFEGVLEQCLLKELENDVDFGIRAYGQDLRTLLVVDECLDQLEMEMICHGQGELPAEDETPNRLNAILVAAVSMESDTESDGTTEKINKDEIKAEKEEDDGPMWSGRPSYFPK
ncbi:hypothetical protein HD554DRAFT_2035454 [Boletus coccyginus]|nr:hypothetical protein HD554DRAFT_2035454 [Boletus coccyginus]